MTSIRQAIILAAGQRRRAIAPIYFLAAVSIHGLPWIDIDLPADYQRAYEVVYPAICKEPHSLLGLSRGATPAWGGGHA
jgi:choline kinase